MIVNSSFFDLPHINSILYYDQTDSTNERAKVFGRKTDVHGILFVAKEQTAGKGRLGRSFISPSSDGIYMSLLLRPDINLVHYPKLTILTGVALAQAIKELTGLTASIKWPNDIVIQGKKVAGILTESGTGYVIVGVGINANNTLFPDSISNIATSLFLETGVFINPSTLLYNFLEKFSSLYDTFLKTLNLSFVMNEYNGFLAGRNTPIYVIPKELSDTHPDSYSIDITSLKPVICKGINCQGELLCQTQTGETITLNSGEISIRGTNGYFS